MNRFDDGREIKNITAPLYDRVKGFSMDVSATFLLLLMILFLDFNEEYAPLIRGALFIVAIILVNTVPHLFTPGHTFGKILSETRVVALDGTDIGYVRMFLREGFKWTLGIFSVGIYYIVMALMVESRKDKRALHDLVFKTKVLSTKVIRR